MTPCAPHEVLPGGLYVVAYHHGPSFTSAVAGLMFVNGVVVSPDPVPGALVRNSGVLRVAHAWEHREGWQLTWTDSWDYRPEAATPPQPPVSVESFSGQGAESQELPEAPRRRGRPRKIRE